MSVEQMRAAFRELQKRLAPAVLADTPDNGMFVRNYCAKRNLDVLNVENLLKAVAFCDEKELLTWTVPPHKYQAEMPLTPAQQRQKTRDEIAAKLKRQIVADSEAQRENRKPYSPKEKAEAFADEKMEQQIQQLIHSYTAYDDANGVSATRVSYAKTEACRKYLTSIKIREKGVYNPALTFRCVKAARFSNVNTVEGLQRAVARELEAINGGY